MLDSLLQRVRSAIIKALDLDGLGLDFETNPNFIDIQSKSGSTKWLSGFEMYFAGLGGILDLDMPGDSYNGPIELSDTELGIRDRLYRDVTALASDIGMRNTRHMESLDAAADYIDNELRSMGFDTRYQCYTTSDGYDVKNIEAELRGTGVDDVLIIGAHYDTVDCPGADDNASGVAALLQMARYLIQEQFKPCHTIRFVAFTNEEPPYFYSSDMGSRVYAEELRKSGDKVLGMICLESLAYFSDETGSQQIPPVLARYYPNARGDFIGFFGDIASKAFLKDVIGRFRRHAEVPSHGLVASSLVQGIDFSDHESFQRVGFNALMVCDTAFMRNIYYHTPEDTADKLDWPRFTKVVVGLAKTVKDLSR